MAIYSQPKKREKKKGGGGVGNKHDAAGRRVNKIKIKSQAQLVPPN